MKKLKVICVVFSCLMLVLLQGCGLLQSRLKRLESEVRDMDKSNTEITNNVLKCFSEKDDKALKDLFCKKTQGLTEIDDQIQTGFDLFKGNVVSFNEDLSGYEGESVEYGKTTQMERSWNIKEIVTDVDEVYEIYIKVYNIYENDKSREGISQMTITSSDGTEYIIGYEWPSYYTEGAEMSYKLITAFGENDIDGIKSLFCTKTLEIADIDEQIQKAFDFFEGRATMGKVNEKYKEYDGKHDYKTSVSEDELVKNNEPTRTSITVGNVNIETDAGKIYQIEFYADLLNDDNETYKGISQIIIKSEDGTKLVIGERIREDI